MSTEARRRPVIRATSLPSRRLRISEVVIVVLFTFAGSFLRMGANLLFPKAVGRARKAES